MKATEHLTVIMNTWNVRPEWLEASVMAVYPQVKRLIISYCEGDDNEDYLKGYAAMCGNVDLCVLPKSEQLGKCPQQSFRQINKAMPMVTTKYVSWASSDDLMWEHKYGYEMDAMMRFEDNKVVYSNYFMTNENLENPSEIKLTTYSLEAHKTGNIVSDLAVWETDLWHEFGGFDCDRFRNYSFWDFWLKVAEKYGEYVFHHLIHPTWYYRQDAESTHIKRRKSPEMQQEANRDRAAMLISHGINP